MKFIKQLWQYIKDSLHRFSQHMADNHARRLALDRKEYNAEIIAESIKMFNFTTFQGRHLGTLNGVVITLFTDEDSLLDRISELRNVYVESKMKEYDDGKDS